MKCVRIVYRVYVLISVLVASLVGCLFLLVVDLDGEEGDMHTGFLRLLAGKQAVAYQDDNNSRDDE